MVKCPMCGTEVKNPEKTWQLVAPLPDAEGRITITVMGVFKCPNCGYRWKTKVSTLKVGPEGEVEIETRKRRKRRKEERKEPKPSGPIIEVDISDIIKEEL
ncbi:MAG TPA: chromatin protein Cren7 [Acidilobales archaeon]|nr:chromatin protein Cren7 [Acidilobales archaeon]